MTRTILRTTTAIALGLSLTAPGAILAANADRAAGAGAFEIAQADNANEKAKGRDMGEEELCADESEPPCDEAAAEAGEAAEEGEKAAGEEAEKTAGKSADAPGQEKKSEEAAEGAAPAVTEEAAEGLEKATDEAASDEPPGQKKKADAAEERTDEAAGDEPPGQEKKADAAEEGEQSPPEKAAEATEEAVDKQDAAASESAEPSEQEKKREEAAADATEEDTDTAEQADESEEKRRVEAGEDSATGEADSVAEERAETDEERETAEDERQAPPAAAAAAADGDKAEPVEVESETVTEETTRESDEEVDEARAERREAAGDDDDDDDLIKILGAAAGGLVVGALLNEAFGGGEVVESTGDRVVVRRGDDYVVRNDETELLRRPGSEVRTERYGDGSSRTVVERENGVQVVTIRDAGGYVVRRSRIMPDGREIVLFDDTGEDARRASIEEFDLPRYDTEPHRRYVDYSRSDERGLRDVLLTRPSVELDRSYTLRQVRENERLRDVMPRLDLDAITFDFGSAAITRSQAYELDRLGRAMSSILEDNPDEVFLIEGHTDAVGSRIDNLVLSDRRAEAVALALTEYYDIPPENLITQGYGEEYLKVETQDAERANRRAAVRRITPLLERTVSR